MTKLSLTHMPVITRIAREIASLSVVRDACLAARLYLTFEEY
jgi:hypothetical protein